MLRLPSPSLAAAAALALGNAVVVVALWGPAGVRDIHDASTLLTGLGRVTGLLGAYLALVQLLLLARLPPLERVVGFDRLTVWHRRGGSPACCCSSHMPCSSPRATRWATASRCQRRWRG